MRSPRSAHAESVSLIAAYCEGRVFAPRVLGLYVGGKVCGLPTLKGCESPLRGVHAQPVIRRSVVRS